MGEFNALYPDRPLVQHGRGFWTFPESGAAFYHPAIHYFRDHIYLLPGIGREGLDHANCIEHAVWRRRWKPD